MWSSPPSIVYAQVYCVCMCACDPLPALCVGMIVRVLDRWYVCVNVRVDRGCAARLFDLGEGVRGGPQTLYERPRVQRARTAAAAGKCDEPGLCGPPAADRAWPTRPHVQSHYLMRAAMASSWVPVAPAVIFVLPIYCPMM